MKVNDKVTNLFGEVGIIISINTNLNTAVVEFEDGFEEEWDLDELIKQED